MDLCQTPMAIDTSSSPPSCHPSCPLHTTLLLYTAEIDHLRREVQRYKDAYQRLQLDMNSLNQKYVAEIEHVANVQHEKDLVEHELEELSCKLFEEANGMVATEKKEKWQLENQLRQTQEYLSAEQTQLVELRERMQTLMAKERRKGSVDPRDPRNRAHDDLQELHGVKRANTHSHPRKHDAHHRIVSMPPPPSKTQTQRTPTIDEFQLEKFREYVQLSRTMPVNKLSHLAYLKYCQTEDIEPCLRFGVHSRLSTKKMMEYLMRQPCFIEQIPSGTPPQETVAVVQRPLWERLSQGRSVAGGGGCAACGRVESHESPLVYRFRFDAQESWLAMDEYCRDRLVAVCEFYVFLRNIRLGFYSDRSVQDLYAENIRLRLQMFYSRMGALPVILQDAGVSLDAVGKASLPDTPEEEVSVEHQAKTGSPPQTAAGNPPQTAAENPPPEKASLLSYAETAATCYEKGGWTLASSSLRPP